MLAVRTLIVVFLTGGLPFGTEAQNRLSQSRQMILRRHALLTLV
jgi:hypothetical protein